MDATPTNPADEAAQPREEPPEAAVRANRTASQVLLHVLTLLIEAGRERLATIGVLTPQEVGDTACAFGTLNVAIIVKRLLRGIKLALALQTRVAANANRIDNPPRPSVRSEGKPGPRPPRKRKPTEAQDNAGLLARLPTDAEIAAMLRHRTIGAVLADICADLGINLPHPLWQEVKFLIVIHGGQQVPVIARTFERIEAARREATAGIAPGWRFYCDWGPDAAIVEGEVIDTTGPPPGSVTA
jgi:hypothetical protein